MEENTKNMLAGLPYRPDTEELRAISITLSISLNLLSSAKLIQSSEYYIYFATFFAVCEILSTSIQIIVSIIDDCQRFLSCTFKRKNRSKNRWLTKHRNKHLQRFLQQR